MSQILQHQRIANPRKEPKHWLYLLHGIYGSGRNWAGLARRLVDARSDWGVVLPDLRLHGGSTSFPPPHTLRACANDLAALEAELGLPAEGIVGHSFGGKVALLRCTDARASVKQVWLVDSSLQTGEPAGTAWEVLEAVRSLPSQFGSRDEAIEGLVQRGYARPLGEWLAMNLERSGDELSWRLDWDSVERMLRDYYATDVWPIVENPPDDVELHIVKASESNALDAATVRRIQAASERSGRVNLHTIQGGHWINVDNPEAVLRLLSSHLP